MYEDYYGLREKPFSIQTDPDFLFMGKRHQLAYTMLEYGIQNRVLFSVISGGIGCGKTTLVRKLLSSLDDSVTVGLVYNNDRSIGGLFEWIMLAFGQPLHGLDPIERYERLQQFLVSEYAARRRVLLVIDEAQTLDVPALESLRLLSNINADKDQLLQVILVGQPELNDVLNRPELHALSQRIGVDFFIPPLDAAEVPAYVRHRLAVAGREKELFTGEALSMIARASGGVPRNINVLCDRALVYGFAAEARVIGADLVDEMLRDRQNYGILQGAQ